MVSYSVERVGRRGRRPSLVGGGGLTRETSGGPPLYIIREVVFLHSNNSSETVIFQNYAILIFLSSIKGTCSP